jgi:hypothetical protein
MKVRYDEQARSNIRNKTVLLQIITLRMVEINNEMAQCHKRSDEWQQLNTNLSLLWAYKITLIEGELTRSK